MNWNDSSEGPASVRATLSTSLTSGDDLGQNRLVTGFHPRQRSGGVVNDQRGRHGVVEISDDSELEEGEEQTDDEDSEGGILLNVDASSRVDSHLDPDTHPGNENLDDRLQDSSTIKFDAKTGKPARARDSCQKSHVKSEASSMFQLDVRRGAQILADLNSEDRENQIRYTLFHLRRDQIDLSRPVVCLACLCEGHTDQYCPGLICSNCEGQTKHSNRLCPQTCRCPRCGERGHDVDSCKAKLKNVSLKPCELCGGADHVEASCTERFFPTPAEIRSKELQLWISCGQCGSKDHLAGDCPARGSKPAHAWSLRTHSNRKIVNLSLQTGAIRREKESQSRGLRPEGIQIRGRAAPRNDKYIRRGGQRQPTSSLQSEGDDDFTTRLAAGRRSRRPSPPRQRIRFSDDYRNRRHREFEDDNDSLRPRSNRPSSFTNYDSYHPPSPPEYRDQHSSYGRDRNYGEDANYHNRRPRLRSRSPARYDGDTWRPPPPPPSLSEPPPPPPPPPQTALPARPVTSRDQQPAQSQEQNWPKKSKRSGSSKNRGGSSGSGGRSTTNKRPNEG